MQEILLTMLNVILRFNPKSNLKMAISQQTVLTWHFSENSCYQSEEVPLGAGQKQSVFMPEAHGVITPFSQHEHKKTRKRQRKTGDLKKDSRILARETEIVKHVHSEE